MKTFPRLSTQEEHFLCIYNFSYNTPLYKFLFNNFVPILRKNPYFSRPVTPREAFILYLTFFSDNLFRRNRVEQTDGWFLLLQTSIRILMNNVVMTQKLKLNKNIKRFVQSAILLSIQERVTANCTQSVVIEAFYTVPRHFIKFQHFATCVMNIFRLRCFHFFYALYIDSRYIMIKPNDI
jgi:hypothetical protein